MLAKLELEATDCEDMRKLELALRASELAFALKETLKHLKDFDSTSYSTLINMYNDLELLHLINE